MSKHNARSDATREASGNGSVRKSLDGSVVCGDKVLGAAKRPLVRLSGIGKTYGETQALDDVSMEAYAGEIVGIVGHNGAGKSTLMRILTGVTPANSGVIEIAGVDMGVRYSPGKARTYGIRVVYQELSLCPNLRVFENLAVHHPELRSIGWGRTSRKLMAASLERVFPNHRIPLSARVSTLSIAERQMVEIASAVATVGAPLRVLVLDEPTSSLDADAANSLFEFLDHKKRQGLLCFFISHRLGEILELTDRVCVLRDGRVAATNSSRKLSREELIRHVGGETARGAESVDRQKAIGGGSLHLDISALSNNRLNDVSISVRAGEIVGMAGLEGQGQRELLQTVFETRHHGRRQRAVRLTVPAAYVSGDRVTEGIFYLWNVGRNITVSGLEKLSRFGIVRSVAERRLTDDWMGRLAISGHANTAIAALSGGNQQKAVVARAMGSQARLILLDDPMRGVDVGTKREFYNLLRQSVDENRSFLWYSTENDELCQCDRVYVMREGRIVEELLPDDLTEERIVKASFRDRPAEETVT